MTLNSCYQCRTYYTIQEVKSDSSAKMSVDGGGLDGPFSPEINYLLYHNYSIENLNVVFLDEKKDTIKHDVEYWYSADDSTGVVEHLKT